MKAQGRPIGQRIRQAGQLLEDMGPSAALPIAKSMEIRHCPAHHYLTRAVTHGLATVDPAQSPRLYTVAPGWRDRVNARPNQRKPKPAAMPSRGVLPKVSSVWELGAMASQQL